MADQVAANRRYRAKQKLKQIEIENRLKKMETHNEELSEALEIASSLKITQTRR